MRLGRGGPRAWFAASVVFHALVGATLWRVRVPVATPAPTLALHLLPAIRRSAEPAVRFVEPQLQPRPVPRPYLEPPPVALDAATLMPGPYPLRAPALDALRAAPVGKPPAPVAVATLAEPVPILARETPTPVVE